MKLTKYIALQPLWKAVWRFLKQPGIKLPCTPAIPVMGICSEKTIIQKDTSNPMFISALFTIARAWKPPRGPSTDAWTRKMGYINTVAYYSTIKRNEIVSCNEV